MTDERDVAASAMQAASQALVDSDPVRDIDKTINDLVRVAVATVPWATGGGVSRLQDGVVHSSHATTDLVRWVDALETQLQQGPCITAAEQHPGDGIVHADDLRGQHDSDTWPRFAPEAADLGLRSLLVVGFRTGHGRYASLNIYAAEPGAFDREGRHLAALFGSQAAMLLYGAESAAGLDRALQSRDVIGQAKGILMERFATGSSTAFAKLVKASQETNVKLTAVAEYVVQLAREREQASGVRETNADLTLGEPEPST